MTNEPVVRVEGLEKAELQLSALEHGIGRAMSESEIAGAKLVSSAVRDRAPVGKYPDPHPGRLRRAVHIAFGHDSAEVEIGDTTTRAYLGPVIFGWSHHNIRPNLFPFKTLEELAPAVVALGVERVETLEREVYG